MVDLKHGDILMCKRDSFLSGVIRNATKSEWSHTAIIIEIWGRLYIVDMQSRGIELNTFDDWVKKWNYDYIIWRYKNANASYEKIAKRAVSKVGKRTKYDYITFLYDPSKKTQKSLLVEYLSFCDEFDKKHSNLV